MLTATRGPAELLDAGMVTPFVLDEEAAQANPPPTAKPPSIGCHRLFEKWVLVDRERHG